MSTFKARVYHVNKESFIEITSKGFHINPTIAQAIQLREELSKLTEEEEKTN